MPTLTLIRHGQSIWNQQNIFTGWANIPLSDKGRTEAINAGIQLANNPIDLVFTSTLLRAQQTATLVMQQHFQQRTPLLSPINDPQHPIQWHQSHNDDILDSCIPFYTDWHLNERYYGDLQGMNKDEARQKFGEEQIHIWRRSYDIPPPNGESLKMTAARTIPFFKKEILSRLQQGQNILISAHGNSLRSIVMELENLSKNEVLSLEIQTGMPISYSYTSGEFQKIT
jgi:2,3-bisphosphoglycerate-dependent phosphoglycerate mutase